MPHDKMKFAARRRTNHLDRPTSELTSTQPSGFINERTQGICGSITAPDLSETDEPFKLYWCVDQRRRMANVAAIPMRNIHAARLNK